MNVISTTCTLPKYCTGCIHLDVKSQTLCVDWQDGERQIIDLHRIQSLLMMPERQTVRPFESVGTPRACTDHTFADEEHTFHWSDNTTSKLNSTLLRTLHVELSASPVEYDYSAELVIPHIKWDMLNGNDDVLYVMEMLMRHGLMRITSIPKEEVDNQYMIPRLFRFLFGDLRMHPRRQDKIWSIKNVYNDSEEAHRENQVIDYRSQTKLPIHFDNTAIDNHSQDTFIMAWMCLQGQSSNGFADGFKCAEILKREDPVAFDLLQEIRFVGLDFRLHYDPTLVYRSNKKLIDAHLWDDSTTVYRQIAQHVLKAHTPICSPAIARSWEKAQLKFQSILDANKEVFELRAGELLLIDNYRMAHSREWASDDRILIGINGNSLDLFEKQRRKLLETALLHQKVFGPNTFCHANGLSLKSLNSIYHDLKSF